MSDRRITIEKIPTAKPNQFIEVSVSYDKGGPNLYGQTSRRGYYLHVTPLELKDHMVCYTLFSGLKQYVEEAARFNPKKLEEVVEKMRNSSVPEILIQQVIAKEKIVMPQ